MAIIRKIYNPTLIIDNLVVAYVPNSLSFSEGLGEQKLRVQTGGGGTIQNVLADDITKRQAKVKFKIEPTANNLAFVRAIKANLDGHVITLSDTDFTRTITGAILVSDYNIELGADSEVELEFMGNPAQ